MNPQEKRRLEVSQDRIVNALERAITLRRLAQEILERKRAEHNLSIMYLAHWWRLLSKAQTEWGYGQKSHRVL